MGVKTKCELLVIMLKSVFFDATCDVCKHTYYKRVYAGNHRYLITSAINGTKNFGISEKA